MVYQLIKIFIIILFVSPAWATDYTVNQDGSGADYSVAEFNALSGDYSDDTFYFSGTITATIIPLVYGTDGHPCTLDGYQSDNTTYADLSEAAGRAKRTTADNFGIKIDGDLDYLIIQDFEITDVNQGIYLLTNVDNIIIRRVYFYEITDDGIYLTDSVNSTVTDCVFKNVGTSTSSADITWTTVNREPHDIIINYNHMYANNQNWGIDGVTSNTGYDILIEYNSIHDHDKNTGDHGEDGIDLKQTTRNVIIRYNEIYSHDNGTTGGGNAINVNSATHDPDTWKITNLYVYGNYIHGNKNGVYWDYDSDSIYLFSNIISETTVNSAFTLGGGSGDASDIYIFNNTLALNSTNPSNSIRSNAYFYLSDALILKNNIFYKSRPNESDYRQYYVSTGADDNITTDYNRYYWPSQTSEIFWGDAGSTNLTGLQGGSGNGLPQETNGSEGDPGLVDIANSDYRINSSDSAIVGAGVDMGTGAIATLTIQGVDYPVYWGIALGPDTDWSATIPSIQELNRDTIGWDIGAYGYYDTGSIRGVSFGSP